MTKRAATTGIVICASITVVLIIALVLVHAYRKFTLLAHAVDQSWFDVVAAETNRVNITAQMTAKPSEAMKKTQSYDALLVAQRGAFQDLSADSFAAITNFENTLATFKTENSDSIAVSDELSTFASQLGTTQNGFREDLNAFNAAVSAYNAAVSAAPSAKILFFATKPTFDTSVLTNPTL